MRHFFIYLILFSSTLSAQKEGNWWYFGNTSSLDFSTNPPSVATGSGMFTYDNASAISDTNGQLLFYTNGVSVWNRLHNVMTNGTGLLGSNSGGQSALIVPQPNSNLYYIFTVPAFAGGALRYSIVDMTLSGGNGAVTIKNQALHTPTTEKIDAHYDCASNTYKIISHQFGTNEFYVYEVNASGIVTTPVISSVGNIHLGGSSAGSQDAMGQLTLSPDGKLLAVAQQFANSIQIFDFNHASGMVSNTRTINYYSAWGLAFSRNSKMLYATQWLTTSVDQIDLTNPATPTIPANIGTVTGTTGGYGAGYPQLAPDDKIYIAKWGSPYLSIIDQPNLAGALCNFIDNGINLGSVVSQAGLCRSISKVAAPISIIDSSNCGTTSFEISDTSGVSAITWDFGGGNTSNLLFPQQQFSPGSHPVSAFVTRCNYIDTITTTINVALNSNLSQFTASNINCTNTVTLNNQSTNSTSFSWNWGNGQSATGAQTSYMYPSPGNYTITLISSNGACSDTSTQNITIAAAINANFTFTTGCANDINVTNLSTNATTYTWNWGNGQTSNGNSPSYTYPNSGPYSVTLIAFNGACSDTVTQPIIIPAGIATNATLTPECNLNLNITNFSTTATSILWNWGNGIQTSGAVTNYVYPTPGNYTVSLILSTGFCTDTIFTNVVISAPINSSFVATPGCNQAISLTNNSTNATNYIWQWGNGQQTTSNLNSYTYSTPGSYTISLIAQNGSCSDTSQQPITVLPAVVAAFTATSNCNQGISIANQSQNGSSYFWAWGDGNSSTNNLNYYQYVSSGNFTISMIALNGLCSDTVTLTVQVDTFPIAQINYLMNGCRDSVQFQSMNPSTSLAWDFGNGFSSTNTNVSSYYPNSGNYNITLINTNLFCADTTTVSIALPGDPNAVATYNLSCDGILLVNPVIDTAWTYTWYFGDGTTSNVVSPTHTYTNSGQYQLSLVVSNGFCKDSSIQALAYSPLNTYIIQSTLDSCSLLATFNLTPVPTDPVSWNFGDGFTSNSSTPAHQYGISNNYNVQAIVNPLTPCADTIDYVLDLSNISSLDNLFLPNSFTPNGDIVNDVYRLENISCDDISISIYNRWGTLVFKSDNATKAWNGKYNGHDLPQGVYVIVVTNKKKTKTETITLLR